MTKANTAVVTDTNEFLHRVLTDGRYIQDFHHKPQAVADSLGVNLSAEAARKLASTDRDVLLDDLYNAKFGSGVTEMHPYILLESETADIFITVAVGIAAGIVTAGVCALIVWARSDFTPVSPPEENELEGLWSRGIMDYSTAAASKL